MGENARRAKYDILPYFLNTPLTVLDGSSVHYIYPGENRPRLDAGSYGKRTFKSNCGVFPNGFENRAAGRSMIDTVRTMVFPNILWATAVSSLFISIQGAAAQTGSAVLIAAGYGIPKYFGNTLY
jgi:hypothetical protein